MKRLSPFSIILVFAVLAIVGAGMIPLLSLQYSPSQKEGELSVSYTWHDAPARLVESEVTSRLEGLIASISGVKGIESTSRKGGGVINVTLKDKDHIEKIRFEIATLLRQTYGKLPDGVSYPNISVATGGSNMEPILTYTVNSELPTQQIEQYVNEYIVKELSLVEGVSSVVLSGATPFYNELRFDPARLKALDISIGELVSVVRSYVSDNNLVGSIDHTGILLTHDFNHSELGKIPIKSSNGKIIRVEDVCEIEYKESLPTRYYRLNGLNTINITVYPQKGANTVAVCTAVKERMEQLKEDFPDNFSALAVNDLSIGIKSEINKITRRTLLSLAVLLLFVFVVSRSLKYLLVIAGSLLANMLISLIFYVLFGIEVHIYTLAGITTSFGIMIDTSIIMLAHYSYWRNRRVFLAILAALLTSIGSLAVIFLLPQEQQLVLRDFAAVIMVNLSVSLLVAMLLIPALVDKFGVMESQTGMTIARARRLVRFNAVYSRYISFTRRWRWAFVLLIAGACGGSFYYFHNNTTDNFYRPLSRPNLYIRASLPQGCTIHQLNDVVKHMENYLAQFDQVEMFRTSITGVDNASITVTFRKDIENTPFPLFLKNEIISKAIDFGGANWSVYGIDDNGFNNNINSDFVGYRITVSGYNFDKVYSYCLTSLEEITRNRRVKDAQIYANYSPRNRREYFIDYNRHTLAQCNISAADAYAALQEQLYSQNAGRFYIGGIRTDINVASRNREAFDVWNLNNEYVNVGEQNIRFAQLGSIDRRDSGMDVYKVDQQYKMDVAFNYLGQSQQAGKLLDREIERLNSQVLPVGFKAEKMKWNYGAFDDPYNIWILLLVVTIIYFMCAILFESLLLPLVIIGLIPVSFIGVSLVFGITEWSFDQGGYASLIMLSGLVVNAGIYILHQYRGMRESAVRADGKAVGNKTPLQLYIKAFNNKIVPISLTVVSTVLGLIPFLMDGPNEVFWFAFAVGTMSGLLFSLLALVFVLPMWIRQSQKD